jgi:membrane-associated phospholipid phosphatase
MGKILLYLTILVSAVFPSPLVSPLYNIGNNLRDGFTGWNAGLQLAGVASTWAIIETGADYRVEQYFYNHEALGNALSPVALTGFVGPVGLSLGFYFYGKRRPDTDLYGAGCALIQANAVSFAYNSLLKAMTGRPNPDYEKYNDMDSLSREFRFGFMRGGIFWGWPSGHVAATVATLSCLTAYYPDKTWLKIGSLLWTGYSIAGVSALGRGHMHWFSDGVAAALMHYAIGSTVGKAFRKQVDGNKKTGKVSRINILPLAGAGYGGMALCYSIFP